MIKKSTEYIRVVRRNGREWKYHFIYSHTEDINDKHVASSNPEYLKYNSTQRHVYIEDISLRESNIIDPSAVKKAGRPVGAKDGYKRTRRSKKSN